MRQSVIVGATVPASVRTLLAPQIAKLAERGYHVEVVTSAGDTELAELPGIAEVHIIPMTRAMSPFSDIRALVDWLRLLRKVRPHAVVTFSPKASLLGIVAGFLTGVRHRVYSTGGLRLETAVGVPRALMWVTEWLTCRLATKVVANSPSLAKVYSSLRLGGGRVVWTMSRKGVEAGRFDPALEYDRVDVAGPTELPVVGFVGRITLDKGVPVLAEALAMLQQDGVGLRALIVGPWEAEESAQLISDLRVATPHLTATGGIGDVRPYYGAMDIFVLPSAREGFPNVVLEAAAMSLPAIVTDATGCVDSVSEQTGITVRAGDARALAAAIQRLVEDTELRLHMGRAARARVVSDFEPARVIDHQLDLMGMGVLPCAASRDS